MKGEDYYSQDRHGPFETWSIGDFDLECGATLRDCQLAYSTQGALSAKKDNVVLAFTWHSGTSKIILDAYVGEGRALDPRRYFIIVVNQIGSGLSTSPHNADATQRGPLFPPVSIADDVRAQHRFITDRFGIDKLALVVGGSMGAQQAYEWAVRYPDMVLRLAALSGTTRSNGFARFLAKATNEAIESDSGWAGGRYASAADVRAGLLGQVQMWSLLGFSQQFFSEETWRAVGFETEQSALHHLLEAETLMMDPNNLLCQGRKWASADVARSYDENLAVALGRITAKTFVMPIDADLVFPQNECRADHELIAGSELRTLHTTFGHFGLFAMEQDFRDQFDQHVRELLAWCR